MGRIGNGVTIVEVEMDTTTANFGAVSSAGHVAEVVIGQSTAILKRVITVLKQIRHRNGRRKKITHNIHQNLRYRRG